ncbi:RlpA-like double-psi beta-barrel-protein domain-containing protein-containing protein [Sporodiniella umbellata]|nr:RlpA-like double-psi beta-barrel-protein domain-containing protein-containing protein [Sporodiniella umbellata]
MRSSFICIATVFLCVLYTVSAKKCGMSIEKSKLKVSGSNLRIRGRVSTQGHCKPDPKGHDHETTTIKVSSHNHISFKDKKGKTHSGKKCTVVANWYNNPGKYHAKKKKEVYVPFHQIKSIHCDDDSKKTTKKHKKTTKKHKKTKKHSSKSSEGYNGKATFFTPNQGACGDWNDNYDMIAALSGEIYGSYSKKSDVCGRKVLVTNKANGKSVKVTIKDACETCDKTHIDLSPAAFAKIGKFDTGILKVEWHYI